MQILSRPLASFYYVLLGLIIVLSLVRAVSPATSRSASWREALTDVMAISVSEGHLDPLEAKVTHIHPTNTRFAAEFPTYTSLVAIPHKLLGPALWHGRLVSLVFALLGLVAFYRILLLAFSNEHFSLLATVLLALSNWLIIGTRVMPDVPAAAMALWGVVFALRYLREAHLKWLFSAALLTLVASLTKLPSLILFAWVILGIKQQSPKRILTLGAVVIVAAIPSAVYYFNWLPQLVESGAMALMYPTSVSEGLAQFFGSHRSNAIDMLLYRGWGGYVLSILGLIGSAVLLVRPVSFIDKQESYVLYGGSLLGLFVFAAKSGSTLATHPYYAIPFLPLLAFGAASILIRARKNMVIYGLCTIALVEIGIRHFAKGKDGRAFAELAQQVEGQLPDGPYVSGFNLNPMPAYSFDRPTWAWSLENINDPELRQAATLEGASGMILRTADTARLSFSYDIFAGNERVVIITY